MVRVYECTRYCLNVEPTRLDLLMEAQSALEAEAAVVSSEAEAEAESPVGELGGPSVTPSSEVSSEVDAESVTLLAISISSISEEVEVVAYPRRLSLTVFIVEEAGTPPRRRCCTSCRDAAATTVATQPRAKNDTTVLPTFMVKSSSNRVV